MQPGLGVPLSSTKGGLRLGARWYTHKHEQAPGGALREGQRSLTGTPVRTLGDLKEWFAPE
jgi:hypothetical protein